MNLLSEGTMSRYLIAPDSFKGAASAIDVCAAIANGVRDADPHADTIELPLADGGEGTVDAMHAAVGGTLSTSAVTGPFLGSTVPARYARITDTTAVIELASCCGLPLVHAARANPELTSTYGVGEQIAHAVRDGATDIILGAGGSATHDLGLGTLAGLGAIITDGHGQTFVPTGATLQRVAHIDTRAVEELLSGVTLTVMCDIDNPVTGQRGAAQIFAPQKGADPAMVSRLEDGSKHICDLAATARGVDLNTVAGAGAAGGLAGGLCGWAGAKLRPGVSVILDAAGFDDLLETVDVIVTGEGTFDSQSFFGKAPVGVARRAKHRGVPVIVLAGACGSDVSLQQLDDAGIRAAVPIGAAPRPLAEAVPQTLVDLRRSAQMLTRLLHC
jgi:glycerate kinase